MARKMSDRLAELEANHAAYERILGPRTYQEVADELAALHMPDETAWLIEFSGQISPTYYGKTDDGLGQTADHLSAIRFCRQQDAQAIIDDIGWTEAKPVEHMWMAEIDHAARRCDTNRVGGMGECLECGADQGEHCRAKA